MRAREATTEDDDDGRGATDRDRPIGDARRCSSDGRASRGTTTATHPSQRVSRDFFELEKRATRSRTRACGCATGRDARAVRGRVERDTGARGERRDGDARVGDGVGGGVGVGETRGRPRGADASVWIVVDRGEGCDGDVCRSRENVDARARAS